MAESLGRVVGFQLVAAEPAEVAGFYRQLFGWSTSRHNALGYLELRTGGIDGGLWPAPVGATSFTQLVIEVADVGARTAAATAAGARLLVPPTALPDGDEVAVLADPAGIPFVLKRASP